MEMQKLWLMFEALPSHAKREVVDFIEFLQDRYKSSKPHEATEKQKLSEEAFVGLWKDREEFRDATAWLRDVRRREWNN